MKTIIDLKKKPDENEKQYQWRLCSAKTSGLLEMSWDELTELFNRELRGNEDGLNKDSYRKPYENARTWYEDVFSKMVDEGYSKEIQVQKRELQKERQKLLATKTEYLRDIRQQSRFELFYENIKEAITTLPLPEFYPLCTELENKKEYVLSICDIHAGAKFVSENNEYSLEICTERFKYLLGETIKFVQDKKLSSIKILEGGDTIQGILRMSDLKLNEVSVVETTVFISRLIAQFLNDLSAYCNVEYYHVPSANHSQNRPLGSKASELASEDVEYIISNYIKDLLVGNKRVTVNLNSEKQYIKIPIFDFECIAMHGHQIKDIKNSLKDLSQLHRTFYDVLFLAHYHSGLESVSGESIVGDTEVLVCPSFVGSDPYSDSLMVGAKASCKIYGFDYYSCHTETYKIVLN